MGSNKRHETSDVELIIVQPLKKQLDVGNTTPLLLHINHEVCGKHELIRVPRNLWVIHTHQLAPQPLRQI